ncbi:MAG: hypothetical protein KKH28_11080 [Elusimicrobia bacterium]|nr:hypothetical protein [Elusimicrobiota bacterium]
MERQTQRAIKLLGNTAAVFLILGFVAACKKAAADKPAEPGKISSSAMPPLPAEPAEPVTIAAPGKPLLPGAAPSSADYYAVSGEAYDDIGDLESAENRSGFVLLGSFGGKWPCKVTDAEKAMGKIEFTLENYGPQAYTGYAGHELKLLRLLCSDDMEAGAVFRSQEKK